MAKKSVGEQVTELCEPIVSSLGYELVEVKYAKGHSGMELTMFIYSKDGISLDDCEKVSRAVDGPLDELNPTNDEPYVLNVSSLGLDRPIKSEADAKRNFGKKVEVKFYAPKDGKKVWTGTLISATENTFMIDANGEQKEFKFDEIAICSPVIDF